MNEWKPISTAPKDGTRIIAAGFDSFEMDWLNVVWFESINQRWEFETGSGWGSCQATHWKPLPDPPKGTGHE